VILNFWATWCAPCRVEMPALQAASERYADQGVVLLAVNASESRDQVADYMDELGLTFPAVLDPQGEIIDLYEVRVFPTTIWIDAEGVVRAEHYGALDDALIDDYLAEISAP
jgi:cytochrome c biogenesis protein CcmG/thiol:disulfide interchange protein DsbE